MMVTNNRMRGGHGGRAGAWRRRLCEQAVLMTRACRADPRRARPPKGNPGITADGAGAARVRPDVAVDNGQVATVGALRQLPQIYPASGPACHRPVCFLTSHACAAWHAASLDPHPFPAW